LFVLENVDISLESRRSKWNLSFRPMHRPQQMYDVNAKINSETTKLSKYTN